MTLSFIHRGGSQMASYRYRAKRPSDLLGGVMNDPSADTLVYCKPQANELQEAHHAAKDGRRIVVDFCDDHFATTPHYASFLRLGSLITCATQVMAKRIKALGRTATVIHEAYEFDEAEPHCNGVNLLWFGHSTNLHSVETLKLNYPIRIVSNAPGAIAWSLPTMKLEMAVADIVLLPKTAEYKSANRAVEAIRQGCFVLAEPHPALKDFPIWQGNIEEGISWAQSNRPQANAMTRQAQDFIRARFSPETLASAWKSLLTASHSTLVRAA